MPAITLRTGVWYNDHSITLTFPDQWDITTHYSNTPKALSEREIRQIVANPTGEPALRLAARGKTEPVIVVDDLARPTPVHRIMPFLLEELNQAGISNDHVRILVATGTHGHQDPRALRNKIGAQAMDTCRVLIHNDQNKRELGYLGKTSYNSPIYINRAVTESDLLIGVGGVYPQHTTGFGGGSKLCLGILGRRTITHLHFKHKGVAGTYNIDNSFRRELDEIARMIGLRTMFVVHINAELEVVSLMCGDHFLFYGDAARLSREWYAAPYPEAEVVIANAYPSDVSYTFMRKAMKVIRCAPANATKITVASNYEGLGIHGLFQQGLSERIQVYKQLYRRISVMEPKVIFRKAVKNLFKLKRTPGGSTGNKGAPAGVPAEKLILFRPEGPTTTIPPLPGVDVLGRWEDVLMRVAREQLSQNHVKVQVYTCASLQCIDDAGRSQPTPAQDLE
jgi:nickel-dependent lactate racemase